MIRQMNMLLLLRFIRRHSCKGIQVHRALYVQCCLQEHNFPILQVNVIFLNLQIDFILTNKHITNL